MKTNDLKCCRCKKVISWEGNPFKPFCSERCKTIDLGAWATGEYRIAGQKDSDDQPTKKDEDNGENNI
jgi:hypothetical protein